MEMDGEAILKVIFLAIVLTALCGCDSGGRGR